MLLQCRDTRDPVDTRSWSTSRRPHSLQWQNTCAGFPSRIPSIHALFSFYLSAADYSLGFTQNWFLGCSPVRARLAVSLFSACATVPCNRHRGKQHVGNFPRSVGEIAVNRRAQYGLWGAAQSGIHWQFFNKKWTCHFHDGDLFLPFSLSVRSANTEDRATAVTNSSLFPLLLKKHHVSSPCGTFYCPR